MTIVRMLKQTWHPQAGGPVDFGQEVTIPNELAEHWDLSGIAEFVEKLGEDSGRLRRPVIAAPESKRPPVRSVARQQPSPEPEPVHEEPVKEAAKPAAAEFPCRVEGCDKVLRTEVGRDGHEKSHKGEKPPKE